MTILLSKSISYNGPIVGVIPDGLPNFSIPEITISPEIVFMFIIHTVIISFVGFMEAIAIARQLEQKEPVKNSKGVELYKYPTPVNSNQELFGQGLGNIASSISGAYPVSGSFSRSAVNESVGSYSPISSITTMLIVMVTLLYATPLLFDLPKSTLGKTLDKFVGFLIWLLAFSTCLFRAVEICCKNPKTRVRLKGFLVFFTAVPSSWFRLISKQYFNNCIKPKYL